VGFVSSREIINAIVLFSRGRIAISRIVVGKEVVFVFCILMWKNCRKKSWNIFFVWEVSTVLSFAAQL